MGGQKRKTEEEKPLVVIAAGSDSDMPHLETLKKELAKFKIASEIRICSAHKQPGRLESEIAKALDENITEKITKLEKADAQLTGKSGETAKVARSCAPSCSETPLVLIAAGSDSDMPHLETLKKEINKFKIDAEIRVCSAHKQPSRLENLLAEYGKSPRPVMMVGCAGGTDALSGTASYLANFPVVSCPPDGMNRTCLTNPPGSSNAFIVKPANVAKFAAQLFSRSSAQVAAALDTNIKEKITKLEAADALLSSGDKR